MAGRLPLFLSLVLVVTCIMWAGAGPEPGPGLPWRVNPRQRKWEAAEAAQQLFVLPPPALAWPIVGCCCIACCTFLQTWALTIRRAAGLPLFRRCLGHVRSQPHNPGKNQRAKKILVYHPPPSQYGCKPFNCTCAKTDDLSIYGTAPDGQTFNCLHWFYVKQGCTKELCGTDQWL